MRLLLSRYGTWVGSPGALLPVVASLLSVLAAPGCQEGCLGGGAMCQVASPCQQLHFTCAAPGALEVRTLAGRSPAGGLDAIGAKGDVLLSNGQVVAVIAGIGDQNFLDPNGGSLLDLGVAGRDNDGLNQILQVVGILPRDAAQYTALEVIQQADLVAVQVRGTLFEFPDVAIYTRYEVRPCEPGIRVRTEIHNGTPDPQLWTLGDGYYWSKREMLPFTPGTGFDHPSFDLLSINGAFQTSPLLAESTHFNTPSEASYSTASCQGLDLEGFHSDTVSSLGLQRAVVPPRASQVFERFLAVGAAGDAGGAADIARQIRQQTGGEALATLRGKVDRGGLGLGSERYASILISRGTMQTPQAQRVPQTQVVPDSTGAYSAAVPAGQDYVLEFHSFGRKVAEAQVLGAGGDRDLGTTVLRSGARLSLKVSDAGGPVPAELFLEAADQPTGAAAAGTLFGQFGACTPWLGAPNGASPACNRVLMPASAMPTTIEVPPGVYQVYAYHGPFYTLGRQQVDLTAGDGAASFTLSALPLLPAGAVSADLHVHGAASFDSSLPDYDRVLSFAAADVGVIIATDHDVVHDYAQVVQQLGLQSRLSTVTGVETTGHIPFLKIPGSDFPLVIGHYNFWPLGYQPDLPRGGGPFDELVEPGALFDRVEPLYTGRVHIAQLNHPLADAEFGRDLGFPRALGMNLLQDLPQGDDGTAEGIYVRVPGGAHHHNNGHQTQEVMNGTANDTLLQYRALWFYFLNQGELHTGTANSDSHGLTDDTIGAPRNVVFTTTQAGPGFDLDQFNQALLDGTSLGTNGPLISATIRDVHGADQPFGMRPFQPAPGAMLQIDVSAAPWVTVDEIRVIVNGRVAKTIQGAALSRPADPFGSAGLLRYSGGVALSEVLAGLPATTDAWIVVEAGFPLPLAADLGGGTDNAPDGIPDTGDNNGDGVVNAADVATGDKVGPLNNPPPPKDQGDPRYHFARVLNSSYPFAFTNPFFLDRNGNGKYDPPGYRGGRP